jgi:hypothetical protein
MYDNTDKAKRGNTDSALSKREFEMQSYLNAECGLQNSVEG